MLCRTFLEIVLHDRINGSQRKRSLRVSGPTYWPPGAQLYLSLPHFSETSISVLYLTHTAPLCDRTDHS